MDIDEIFKISLYWANLDFIKFSLPYSPRTSPHRDKILVNNPAVGDIAANPTNLAWRHSAYVSND